MMDDVGCDECGFNTCMCVGSPNNPDYAQGRYEEREAILAYLRQGGETVRDVWYSWDSEMCGYYASVAERIARGDHDK